MSVDVYVSTDIETDGFIPGINSMLSFGSAAFLADKTLISTFSANLETLPGATPNPHTEKWWLTQPKAWAACRENIQKPHTAMQAYADWLEQLPGRLLFLAYPVAFDFSFICYYLHHFVGKNPFGFACIDIRSYIMGMQNLSYQQAAMSNYPRAWFDNLPHTHIALEDAIEQGTVFCNVLQQQKVLHTADPQPKLP